MAIIRSPKRDDVESVSSIFSLYWPEEELRNKFLSRFVDFLNQKPEAIEQGLTYFVAEDDSEVVGIIGFRKCPAHMVQFSTTDSPAELYILAVKNLKRGIGKMLIERVLAESRSRGYGEMVLYSGETHSAYWGFYAHIGFTRVGPAAAPNGEPGQIWRMALK